MSPMQAFSPISNPSCLVLSILAEAKNLSFNATAAFHAYSNIKDFIEEAERLAKQAKARGMEAVQLVSHAHTCACDLAINPPVVDSHTPSNQSPGLFECSHCDLFSVSLL